MINEALFKKLIRKQNPDKVWHPFVFCSNSQESSLCSEVDFARYATDSPLDSGLGFDWDFLTCHLIMLFKGIIAKIISRLFYI